MKVLLLRMAQVRPELRENHEAGVLTGLLAIAGYVNDPERLRIAVVPRDNDYIEESLDWCDAVGFGATTAEIEPMRTLARRIRTEQPNKRLFLGGIHATLVNGYDRELFDFMVAGEGEKVVRDLVRDRLDIGERQIYTADAPLSVDDIPLIDFGHYHDWQSFRGRPPPLTLSRGCPRPTCRYCSVVGMWKKCRALPVERAVEQIEMLSERFGSTRFNIWDDTFSDDPVFVEALLRALEARGLSFDDASCFCRTTSALDPDVLPLFDRLGIKVLLPGHESGSDRMLKYLKGSRAGIEHSHRNCVRARELGMQVLGSVMFGCPTETLDEMHETLDFMRWLIDNRVLGEVWPYLAQPMPGTRFWNVALERGKVSPDMDFDRLGFEDFANPLLLEQEIPRAEFAEVIASAGELSRELRELSREAG